MSIMGEIMGFPATGGPNMSGHCLHFLSNVWCCFIFVVFRVIFLLIIVFISLAIIYSIHLP